MSRRTKLIIAALFLMLLVVPAVYVALTWHPEDPLRFRVVDVQEPSSVEDRGEYKALMIEVRNTAAASVHLEHIRMTDEAARGNVETEVGMLIPEFFHDGELLTGGWVVPAHGTLRFSFLIPVTDVTDAVHGEFHIFYFWMSQSKHIVCAACDWLWDELPEKFESSRPPFHIGEMGTPLEPMRP